VPVAHRSAVRTIALHKNVTLYRSHPMDHPLYSRPIDDPGVFGQTRQTPRKSQQDIPHANRIVPKLFVITAALIRLNALFGRPRFDRHKLTGAKTVILRRASVAEKRMPTMTGAMSQEGAHNRLTGHLFLH